MSVLSVRHQEKFVDNSSSSMMFFGNDSDSDSLLSWEDQNEGPLMLRLSSHSSSDCDYDCDDSESSSSLQSKRKKSVRFADEHGKELVSVRMFESDENEELAMVMSKLATIMQRRVPPIATPNIYHDTECLQLLFPDPMSNYSRFICEKMQTQYIALENVCYRAASIKGLVRVRNLSFEKNVFVRLTFDYWATQQDWKADIFPVITSNDYDLFEFMVPIPPYLKPGALVEFCVCYQDSGREFWDNNFNQNFAIRYRPKQQAASTSNSKPAEIGVDEQTQLVREVIWSEFASWNNRETSEESGKITNNNKKQQVANISIRSQGPHCLEIPYYW